MKALILAALLAAAPAAVLAAPAPAWTVDRAASNITFASSFSGDAFTGKFARWSAVIRFDPANLPGSSVTATIEPASALTGDKDRDQSLPSDDFFAAAKFPKATFVSTSIRSVGPGRYEAVGQLTLRGVTRPLTLPFALAITGAQAKMTAKVAINRLAFGVGQGEWKAVESIPAAVGLAVSLTATRAP